MPKNKIRNTELPEYLQICVNFQAVYFTVIMLDEKLLQYYHIIFLKETKVHIIR